MDVTFNNVLEGTRQYFMGLPKQAQADGSGQPVWPAGAPLPEEGTPAQSGAPAPSSRPPSAAAAPPAPSSTPIAVPSRPPSEPLEPEPHIIHKATVMREAAEKRRELPEVEDDEEPGGTHSPPTHIIHKPPPRNQPSPAPAPAAPCPSPARPPSIAPLPTPPAPEPQPELPVQYRPTIHRVQTPTSRPPDAFAPSRPPDPHSASRPPEQYSRYHYESSIPDGGRNSYGPVASPQPSLPPRHSPQTYARLSGSIPQHAASRLRESAAHSPPAQRYAMPSPQPPPPHNDRVPPIHHPQTTPSSHRLPALDGRASHIYPPLQQRRENSPYARLPSQYERQPVVPTRKYDPQQAYPGYRPSSVPQVVQSQHIEPQQQMQYKHAAIDTRNSQYLNRAPERTAAPVATPQSHEPVRLPPRVDYPTMSRNIDNRSGYQYPTPSTSSRYSSSNVPTTPNSIQPRTAYRAATAPKTNYDYTTTSHSVQTSPARSSSKPGYPNQQARMTVSVTSLVNQMKQKREPSIATVAQVNPTKLKRESPLDLSVKTVKNSADSSTSSTTQDDVVDSASVENKSFSLPPRPSTISSRHAHVPAAGYVASHKVDFAPNFNQYGERNTSHNYSAVPQAGHPPVRYNGSYDVRRPIPEQYPIESPHLLYQDRNKYNIPVRPDCVPKIDLTRSGDLRLPDHRVRDDRNFIIEERKRPAGPIVSNIPEKIVRYETWTADSRIDRMNQSAREQHELMSRPVYSYSSHKQFEAYQNDQKRASSSGVYREHHLHGSHRYSATGYPTELPVRELPPTDYHSHYHDRSPSMHNRHQVIQKIPSHRDVQVHPHHLETLNRVPAKQSVLSILRNSLETKHSVHAEPIRSVKPDIIVIDDVDDNVIEITDLTKENDASEANSKSALKSIPNASLQGTHHIQMPKAIDSIPKDSEYQQFDNPDVKSKSPENDVASRIRTKAELKVMPPSQDTSVKPEAKQNSTCESEKVKPLPKSQKQHLFNQIREDLRLESVIKVEKPIEPFIPEVKTEPMNIEEIERDAAITIKTENGLDSVETVAADNLPETSDDLDWIGACDSFMEQLKTGCHKKKTHKRRSEPQPPESEKKIEQPQAIDTSDSNLQKASEEIEQLTPIPNVVIKQEPMDEDDVEKEIVATPQKEHNVPMETSNPIPEPEPEPKPDPLPKTKSIKKEDTDKKVEKQKKLEKRKKNEGERSKKQKHKNKSDKVVPNTSNTVIKKEPKESKDHEKEKDNVAIKTVIKEEQESTDDDEPLIKSKILKEKQNSDRLKYQLLKDLSEKSAYVKLEFCDVDVNKNTRKSLDTSAKEKDDKQIKGKASRQSRPKVKSLSTEITKNNKVEADSSSDSDDDLCVASRLRVRKNTKTEDSKGVSSTKTPVKSSPKKLDSSSTSNTSTPIRKPGFGDGSDFHPGWEEELYRYKRSLRMPTRLIAIPRGRSGGPFVRGSGAFFSRGTTSLPDLDPAPLSPAPSSAPSAATDDLYARRPDKLILDSDLDSNSSCSAPNRLHYDSEASTSTVFSTKPKKKGSSIVDVLIQKCGRKEDSKKRNKERDDKTPKAMPKGSNTSELLPTPSLGLLKNNIKGSLSAKKEKLVEDIFYLGAFRKETVTAYRHDFLNNTDGLLGATEEFTPVMLKSRTRTESRVLKHRATIKEVFGDERPASAPPTSCRDDDSTDIEKAEPIVVKKEPTAKPKLKPKKILKDKLRRSSSIRDGLRSTKSLKRNDAKGRLMRLKKRNSMMKNFNNKRLKDLSANKHKTESPATAGKNTEKEGTGPPVSAEGSAEGKKRFKRLFARRKFSSGFDYIRKKKKIIRRDDNSSTKIRRPAAKPNPESVHDIHKEIKGWFINKSVGETHLHRAARLGYTVSILSIGGI